MATLTIDGRKVTVDDSFLKLSPAEQNQTVDEIAASFPKAAPAGPAAAPAGPATGPDGRPRIYIPGRPETATPPAEGPPVPDAGALNAFGRGAAQGFTANFYDELRGLVEASGADTKDPASLYKLISGAAKYWTGDEDAAKRYQEAADRERQLTKTAEEQHPVASIAGNVAGALALPVGVGAQATTLPGRIGTGIRTGALLGAAAGFGGGVGAEDTIQHGATGAVLGSAFGGGAPVVIKGAELLGRGAAKLASPITSIWRGVANPDAEAARRILAAQQRDVRTGTPGMSEADWAAAKARGDPVINADRGGEATQALARSAANTSPEGRAALTAATNERYVTQSSRLANWIKEIFDFPDPGAALERLQEAARRTNRPAYNKAYAEGQSIWDDGLAQYAQAPIVQKAIQLAFVTGRNRAAMEGYPVLKNPFVLNKQTGVLELQPGATPNLQFWDHVKRNLDQMGAEGQAFSKALRNHLDDLVPSYKEARSGAAKFFGAEDAMEAGAKFATMSGRDAISLSEARRGLAAMSPAERKLFETGFVSNLIAKVEALKDGQDVVKNIFNSETARKQIRLAIGEQRANELEAKLLTERAMNGIRNAVQSNSTTARQWIERGLAGGAGGVGGLGVYDMDASKMSTAALTGAIIFSGKKIDQRVARRVAEMLASDNPAVLNAANKIVAKSAAFRNALLNIDIPAARVGGTQAGGFPAIQAGAIGRADEQQQPVPGPVQ